MKSLRKITACSQGFTLVEIIVTLVAAGILGVIFLNLMGSALDDSWNAVENVRGGANSEGVMEQIVADYVQLINTNPGGALASIVTNYNGQTINGINLTTQYITFDAGGNEVSSGGPSDNLKVMTQALDDNNERISYQHTIILTNSRTAGDPIILY
jgi:prepilin-type N-terminal cleavage/methylation domain-containing protein